MKIEGRLICSNMKENMRRTIFTIISIILCSFLIFTTILVISSIRNGITENIENDYNDYHFMIKDLDLNSFNIIKDKEYIEKIYIQKGENEKLEEYKNTSIIDEDNNINVYIKYKEIKKTSEYSTDIVQTLNMSYNEAYSKCEFNEKLLTIYGIIDIELNYTDYTQTEIIYKTTLNFSYIIDIMIVLVIFVFSAIFVIILYNAFLITINERKKEYAILNSIGATETQVLKMVFIEATVMGIIGIIIGGLISYLGVNVVLKLINEILLPTTYNFRLVIDIKYIIIALAIVMFNIYISAIIPSTKASSTSIIQEIRNNKQIKYKKGNKILEKILPIEGKIALKNYKRNKNKYRVITILLVICMTSFITVSTYINYEKEASNLVDQYGVDAELSVIDNAKAIYKSILDNYKNKNDSNLEYMEHKIMGLSALVEPKESVVYDIEKSGMRVIENEKVLMTIELIGLDENMYNKYIKKINAQYGDSIICNTLVDYDVVSEQIYGYDTIFKNNYDLKLSIVNVFGDPFSDKEIEYDIIDDKSLAENIVITDEILDEYKDFKLYNSGWPLVFINMETFNKIEENNDSYCKKNNVTLTEWINYARDPKLVRIKCDNIIEFSNYIEEVKKEENIEIYGDYYSLENQEKKIYINILQLVLEIIIVVIIAIGIISATNIINASISERKQEFKILSDLGATKRNINKILLNECIYMFVKALIISIIISIPIIYGIIKYMEQLIILDKLLIPFESICVFIIVLFILSVTVTIYSTKSAQKV